MSDQELLATFRIHVDRLFIKPEDQIGKQLHAAVGVSGEAGELLDAVKKTWIYSKPLDRENCVEELGDLLFYMQAFAIHTGVTWKEIIEHNIKKLEKRYPSGYTDQAAQQRADKA